jgi:hypothetical protein
MRLLSAALAALLLPGAAKATNAELRHLETLPGLRAASIAYDAQLCGIWVANEGPDVVLLTTGGREILRFTADLYAVRSLTVDEDGLILADGWGGFQLVDREGRPRPGTFNHATTLRDTEGMHRDADGSVLVVEDDPSRLLRIAPDGTVMMELFGRDFDPPMEEPQGVTRDPYSGNILVVDDNEGLNSLFELAPDGAVISVTPLSAYGVDAEGVALQPETGTLFVGFDAGQALSIFAWKPSRSSIDAPLDRGPDCAFM